MTLLELVYALRLRLDDCGGSTGTAPDGYTYYWEYADTGCLWKNAELVRFINDARNELCRRVPIVDSTSSETELSLVTGEFTVDLDPSILAIRQVYNVTDSFVLTKTAHQFETPETLESATACSVYLENLNDFILTVYGPAEKATTLQLTVERLPLDALAWSRRTTDDDEIPTQFQPALVEYAAHLAWLKNDADTYSAEKSVLALQTFDRLIGPSRSAVDLRWIKHTAGRAWHSRPTYF